MAPDQPEPDHTPEPTINLVIVDPDALRSAARHLDDLPGPDDRAANPPSAADVGDRDLADEIAEFDQQLRAVESALITDTGDVVAQLGDAAERYRRADDETTSQLVELQEALSRRSDPDCSDEDRDDHDGDDHDRDRDDHDRDDHDRDDHDRDDHRDDDRDSRTLYEV